MVQTILIWGKGKNILTQSRETERKIKCQNPLTF